MDRPSDRQIEAFLWKIANTLESLEKTGRTTAYSLLRMRVIDGLNVPQLKRILRAQG
ncbi:MAG: hypothetical protein IGR93_01515 [Hydrococcus sp. C42_A2020_068]|uniref:hypothetical protein n=1 Tax=Pleurocapsa sp. PCC 7327 TaxID=118163 RepID=UPI000313CED9|nr:hypothetical protein [Pleurocapsa sp. PCC 7327]MBF2018806.1 hypothetical protein [Hydrococcus sp. C42_A2020_068]